MKQPCQPDPLAAFALPPRRRRVRLAGGGSAVGDMNVFLAALAGVLILAGVLALGLGGV